VESVFPRIGLKSFVQLSAEEKKQQLDELSSIVTGIRLFNKESGKGGAGLESVEILASNKVAEVRGSEERRKDGRSEGPQEQRTAGAKRKQKHNTDFLHI